MRQRNRRPHSSTRNHGSRVVEGPGACHHTLAGTLASIEPSAGETLCGRRIGLAMVIVMGTVPGEGSKSSSATADADRHAPYRASRGSSSLLRATDLQTYGMYMYAPPARTHVKGGRETKPNTPRHADRPRAVHRTGDAVARRRSPIDGGQPLGFELSASVRRCAVSATSNGAVTPNGEGRFAPQRQGARPFANDKNGDPQSRQWRCSAALPLLPQGDAKTCTCLLSAQSGMAPTVRRGACTYRYVLAHDTCRPHVALSCARPPFSATTHTRSVMDFFFFMLSLLRAAGNPS
jgi:hypothetical protein